MLESSCFGKHDIKEILLLVQCMMLWVITSLKVVGIAEALALPTVVGSSCVCMTKIMTLVN